MFKHSISENLLVVTSTCLNIPSRLQNNLDLETFNDVIRSNNDIAEHAGLESGRRKSPNNCRNQLLYSYYHYHHPVSPSQLAIFGKKVNLTHSKQHFHLFFKRKPQLLKRE